MKRVLPAFIQGRASLAPAGTDRRRRLLLCAGAAGLAATAGAASVYTKIGSGARPLPDGLDLRKMEPLGDGFYLVEGWVLSAADIDRLGGDPTDGARGGI